MSLQPRQTTTTKASAIALALLAATLAVAGCGGSSTPTKSVVQSAHPTAVPSSPDVGQAPAQAGPSATAKASPGNQPQANGQAPAVQQARSRPGATNAGAAESAPRPLNPCTLVSVSQANAITAGAVVGALEAPLGPTCIYKLGNGSPDVTLAVESMSFSQVAHQMRGRSPVTVGGRGGYCGRLGAQMLFVPLPGGRVLNVTAPCAQAQRFAAAALSHLAA